MPSSDDGERVVVADTSPILNLGLVDRLDLCLEQFDSMRVPGSRS